MPARGARRRRTAVRRTPADAGGDGLGSQHAAGGLREAASTWPACLVAVAVVDGLEVIEVEGEHGERPALRRAAHQTAALFEEPAAVAQAGQVVGLRFAQQCPWVSSRTSFSRVIGRMTEYSTPSYIVIWLASICMGSPPAVTSHGRTKVRAA